MTVADSPTGPAQPGGLWEPNPESFAANPDTGSDLFDPADAPEGEGEFGSRAVAQYLTPPRALPGENAEEIGVGGPEEDQ